MTTITISKNVMTTDTMETDVSLLGNKDTLKEEAIRVLQFLELDIKEYNDAIESIDDFIASPKFNYDLSMNFDEEGKWINLNQKANFFINGERISKVAFTGNVTNIPYYVKIFNKSNLSSEDRLDKYVKNNTKMLRKYGLDYCTYFIFIGETNAFAFLPSYGEEVEEVEITFPLDSEDVLVLGSGVVSLIQQGYKPKSGQYIFDNIEVNEIHRITSEFDQYSNFDLRSIKV